MPVFSAINKEVREQIFLYIVVISFVLNYLIPFIAKIVHFTITYKIPFDIGLDYLIYILIGYLLHKKEIVTKWKRVIYVLAFAGFALKVGGTYYLSLQTGALDGTFGHYNNVPCFLLSVGMFVLLKDIGTKMKSKLWIRVFEYLSGFTMASYVLHQYVLEYLIGPMKWNVYSLGYNMITPVITFFICVVITMILRKIPFVQRLVP